MITTPPTPPDSEGPAIRYHSFLLRLWCNEESWSWHASLEHPLTHERLSFASLDALFAWLRGATEGASPPSVTEDDGAGLRHP